MIAEDDKVAARIHCECRCPDSRGMPDKKIDATLVFRVENGKIVEHWGHSDSFFWKHGMGQESAVKGAEASIPKLLDTYGGRIYGLGLRMCGNPQDAEGLVQETFLQAFRKWDPFEGRSKASTWLYTIAARLCQRRKRRRAGEPERLDSLEQLLPQREVASSAATRDDPFRALSQKEAQEAAETALVKLPPRFRLPLLLKELTDLPITHIAEALRVKESTVKTRIHRARLFLTAEMSKIPIEGRV